eukprot:13767395-Ditylum_brightwellii.AAC.1
MQQDTETVFSSMLDPQSASQIYTNCLIQRMPFHICFDVMHNTTETADNPHTWKLPLAEAIDSTTKQMLKTIAQTDNLPAHAFELATLPRSHNGLGIFTPSCSALLAFVLPFIRAIKYATAGMKLRHKS